MKIKIMLGKILVLALSIVFISLLAIAVTPQTIEPIYKLVMAATLCGGVVISTIIVMVIS